MPQTTAVNPIVQLLPLALIFAIFYFLIIRPQKQKEKEHQKMLSALNKNDEVVTMAGIHGTIVNLKEKTLTLRVDENVKIEIDRSSVAYVKKTS
ncbi:MAG: preprotein translocase subunit YajC [Candidatus Omnitrophica bacterium]|jgi:preprotein translocase subunit YajC|nr:preprotein translocase subunit YajC [Candidatus Omnitrophota bacterium]MDD5078622.1 preprotein translocase subunit YajC [Candidatus Omnitrophota bacterium]MDD5725688.1 preprotein translocase subunit YajC [Candidatus Omnitrophota bacterium]